MSEKWSRWNPDYRRGYKLGRAQRRAESGSGCRKTTVVLLLIPTAVGLAGWGAGALLGVLT